MINYNGMEAKKSYFSEPLPAGGYVESIFDAKIETTQYGDRLSIFIDVAEGTFKNFFLNDYKSNDKEYKKWKGVCRLNIPNEKSQYFEIQKRTFNNFIACIEESNPGYTFDGDESKLKGKLIGGLHRNKEWEFNGKTGWATELSDFRSVDQIRSGKFKVPKDKPLKQSANTQGREIAADDDSELPF